jgi:glycosyltransferase involved in cell wall biosynthesis
MSVTTDHATLRVIHIIPYDGIGGVETAARSMQMKTYGTIEFRRFYLTGDVRYGDARNVIPNCSGHRTSPFTIVANSIRIARLKPDVVIASLWRSVIAALLIKTMRPRVKLVTMIHFPKNVHWIDAIVHRIAFRLSAEIWADSQATLKERIPPNTSAHRRTISFLVDRDEPHPRSEPRPTFIFWGRLHSQKGLVRALQLFKLVQEQIPNAIFWILGPDGGDLSGLKILASRLHLDANVHFLGPATREEIRRYARDATFYLQTSRAEGMGLSVVEAMQVGLVPVVTAVGEISSYAVDGQNSIIVGDSLNAAASRLLALLGDAENVHRLRDAAISTWVNKPLYRDDVIAACEILGAGAGA